MRTREEFQANIEALILSTGLGKPSLQENMIISIAGFLYESFLEPDMESLLSDFYLFATQEEICNPEVIEAFLKIRTSQISDKTNEDWQVKWLQVLRANIEAPQQFQTSMSDLAKMSPEIPYQNSHEIIKADPIDMIDSLAGLDSTSITDHTHFVWVNEGESENYREVVSQDSDNDSSDFYCAEVDKTGYRCSEGQCPSCVKTNLL